VTINVFLLLSESPDDPLTFMRVDAGGRLLSRGECTGFADYVAKHAHEGDSVIAFLPGELVAMRQMPSPPRGRAAFVSAARFLFEDTSAGDIDGLHVAVGRVGSGGLCLGVDADIMAGWTAAFEEADLYPARLLPDYLGLPLPERDGTAPSDEEGEPPDRVRATVFIHHDGLFANSTRGGFSTDRYTSDSVLEDIFRVWDAGLIDLYADKNIEGLEALAGEVRFHPPASIEALAALFHRALGASGTAGRQEVNLLTGIFAPRVDWMRSVRPWRWPAIAAGFCLVALLANWVIEGNRASREAERMRAHMAEIHREAFPDAGNADPVSHAREVLAAEGAGADFLSLWLRFADAIEEEENLQIDSLTFLDEGRVFRVSIRVDSQSTLDNFKLALAERGLTAQEGVLNRVSSAQFSGELTITL